MKIKLNISFSSIEKESLCNRAINLVMHSPLICSNLTSDEQIEIANELNKLSNPIVLLLFVIEKSCKIIRTVIL